MIIVFTSAGLPGLAGFIGEFLVIIGTGDSQVLFFGEATPLLGDMGPETSAFVFTAIAATGVIFGAVYLLWMFQRVMFGPLKNPKNENLPDLNAREVAYMMPIVIMGFVMGLFPHLFLDKMHSSVDHFLAQMEPAITAKANPGAAPAAVAKKTGDRPTVRDFVKPDGAPTLSKKGAARIQALHRSGRLSPKGKRKKARGPKPIKLTPSQVNRLFKDGALKRPPGGGTP
jgi:NADH-quinone oxidoreductase subunit M